MNGPATSQAVQKEAAAPTGSSNTVVDAEVAEILLRAAYLDGIRHLWFVSGSELTPLQEASAKSRALGFKSPELVTMIHEHVALSAAMGETMMTGGPSMTAAHADLGLLHYGGALHNALRGSYPVLITSGYPATTPQQRKVPVFWKQQRWDQGQIVRQYVKWDHKLSPLDDPSLVVSRAVQVMLGDPAGPAYLAIPAEVAPYRMHGELDMTTTDDLGRVLLGPGDVAQVKEMARRLLEAENPLIVTDRVGNDVEAVEVLARVSKTFGIPVVASRHRMNFPDDHPGAFSPWTVTEADVVIVLESDIPWIPALQRPGKAFIVAVGTDPAACEIPLYEFPAQVRLLARPAAFLRQLEEELSLERRSSHDAAISKRWAALEESKRKTEKATDEALRRDLAGPIITERMLSHAVGEVLDPEDLLTWELGPTEGCKRTIPRTLFDSGGSSLGWGVAAAAGAQKADPGRPAICITGDGSYSFGSPHALLWTQLHHELPVMTVICNNRGYRTGTVKLMNDYPGGYSDTNQDLTGGFFDPPPNYSAEAEAAGARGFKVTHKADLPGALREAKAALVTDRLPSVIDVWLPQHVTGRHPATEG